MEEPNCDQELPGSMLVTETCQDKIGGTLFGYDLEINAPRKGDCPASGKFASALAQRCCNDGVAYCNTFFGSGMEGDVTLTQQKEPSLSISNSTSSPTPLPTSSTPTMSNAPTYDGHLITVLIQLDDFPLETGFSITTNMGNEQNNVTFFERQPGFYSTPGELVVEKVRIPLGLKAILTLTDTEDDGICCSNGNGYVQVYSDEGSILLDEDGIFGTSFSKSFYVGEPETNAPTISAPPTESAAPTFDQYPITIEVQLDQWSGETGFSIKSIDESLTFFNWRTGSFTNQAGGIVVETVQLPSDIDANLIVTDQTGDGFCEYINGASTK